MKKQGPCLHCGTNSTPLWRNGPSEKPVLCNACGSRYRTRGTLANYAPKHAQIQQPIPPKRFRINKRFSKKPKYKSIENLYSTSVPYSTCPDNDCRAWDTEASSDSMMSLPRTSCSDDVNDKLSKGVGEHDRENLGLQIGGHVPHGEGVAQATVPIAQVVKRLREDLQITREELNLPSSKTCSLGNARGLKLIVDFSKYNLKGLREK